jgi:hypothetical protein
MSRDEIQRIASRPAETPAVPAQVSKAPSAKPIVPAGVREYFLKGGGGPGTAYRPVLYGAARIHYSDTRRGVDAARSVQAAVPFAEGAIPVDWERADDSAEPPDSLAEMKTAPQAAYAPLPAAALDPKRYVEWREDFAEWIVRAQPLRLFRAPALKLQSEPGESERDFRIRTRQAARELRDASVETLRARFAPKIARVTGKARKAREALEREQQQVGHQKLQTVVSLGATVIGALMGRKAASISTLGRATTAARGVGRSMKEAEDVQRAQERLREAEAELTAIDAELKREIAALEHKADASVAIEVIEIKPKRSGVDVRLVALAWQPCSVGG